MMYQIAIDGLAGSGKGTTAKGVAQRLGFRHIDTGAMYRGLARYLHTHQIPLEQKNILTCLSDVGLSFDENNHLRVNGKDVEDEIRTSKISGIIPHFVNIPKVRSRMVAQQQKIAQDQDVVMEGRDIGSVVLPSADVKVFLTAEVEVRARRRLQDAQRKDSTITLQTLIDNLQTRDKADQPQLQKLFDLYPDEVITIDTTTLTIAQQIDRIIEVFETTT